MNEKRPMKKFFKSVWDFLMEWEAVTIIAFSALVTFSYDLIRLAFPNIPWDQRLNPGVDSFIYWAQTNVIFFATSMILWWWIRQNFSAFNEPLKPEFLSAAIKAGMEHKPLVTVMYIAFFFVAMLYIFSQFMQAVFP